MILWKNGKKWTTGFDYYISNLGRVKNKHGRILTLQLNDKGYLRVCLQINGKSKWYRVSRLVAEAFIPNPENKPEVDHINRNRADNRAENLRWVTRLENMNNSNLSSREVYCLDLDKIFSSTTEASVHTGVCRTSIVKACRGQLHQAGGMLWCYSKDKDKMFPH